MSEYAHGKRRERGQSLAEFALVLPIFALVVLGIIQLGFIFNAYVTVANAAREGAREGSIYVYAYSLGGQAQNDSARLSTIRAAVRSSMGILSPTAPNLADSDISVTYSGASGCPNAVPGQPTTDTRKGQYVCVRLTYHLDLLVADLLPENLQGRLVIPAQVSMVIN